MGLSAPTLQKARAIVQAAAADPAYAPLVADMDHGEPVVSVYSALKRQQRTEEAQRVAATLTDDDFGIHEGDFREIGQQIPEASVSLIFTDPPYDRETVPLYGDLAAFGGRVLKPGGSLIAYIGEYALPEILNLMTPHLTWWWSLVILHSAQHARLRQRGVFVEKKLLVWFVNGDMRAERTLVSDVLRCDRDKRFHEWGQGIQPALHCIECLSAPGELIADPFCGGGTSMLAARQLGRRGWASDIDPVAVAIARARMAQMTERRCSLRFARRRAAAHSSRVVTA